MTPPTHTHTPPHKSVRSFINQSGRKIREKNIKHNLTLFKMCFQMRRHALAPEFFVLRGVFSRLEPERISQFIKNKTAQRDSWLHPGYLRRHRNVDKTTDLKDDNGFCCSEGSSDLTGPMLLEWKKLGSTRTLPRTDPTEQSKEEDHKEVTTNQIVPLTELQRSSVEKLLTALLRICPTQKHGGGSIMM